MSSLIKKVKDNIDSVSIYEHYLSQPISLTKPICSPFRNEKRPSFSFFMSNKDREVWFKDHGDDSIKGDCINFVSLLFDISIYEACQKILNDFGVTQDNRFSNLEKRIMSEIKPKPKTYIKIIKKPWTKGDKRLWDSLKIGLRTLIEYNVFPISKAIVVKEDQEKVFEYTRNVYAYLYPNGHCKIYNPLSINKSLAILFVKV